MLTERLAAYAEKFERKFELRFETVARDPRVLAFLGSSLNAAARFRLESQKLEIELASFRARLQVAKLSASREKRPPL